MSGVSPRTTRRPSSRMADLLLRRLLDDRLGRRVALGVELDAVADDVEGQDLATVPAVARSPLDLVVGDGEQRTDRVEVLLVEVPGAHFQLAVARLLERGERSEQVVLAGGALH